MDAFATERLEVFLIQESIKQEEASRTSSSQPEEPSAVAGQSSDTWEETTYTCYVNSALSVNIDLMHAHNQFHQYHSVLGIEFFESNSQWLEISTPTAVGRGRFSDFHAGGYTDYELSFRFKQRRCLWGRCFGRWTTEKRHCHCGGSAQDHTCALFNGYG